MIITTIFTKVMIIIIRKRRDGDSGNRGSRQGQRPEKDCGCQETGDYHLGEDHLGKDHLGEDNLDENQLSEDCLGDEDHLGEDNISDGDLGDISSKTSGYALLHDSCLIF